jgi:hypothetical protein
MTKSALTFTALLLASTTSTLAQSQTPQPGATYDFTKPLLTAAGKPMKDESTRPQSDPQTSDPLCNHCDVITLGQLAAACLDNDAKAPADKKAAQWALANRIFGNRAASLDSHQKTMIEDCANNTLSPLAAGQIDHLLEPDKFPEK